jgi:hypothetical protein
MLNIQIMSGVMNETRMLTARNHKDRGNGQMIVQVSAADYHDLQSAAD